MPHQMVKADLSQTLLDPAFAYREPESVVRDQTLCAEQKAEVLCRWAYDAIELAVADEEGMSGGDAVDLGRILKALDAVTGGFDTEHTAPTKHAGFCVH